MTPVLKTLTAAGAVLLVGAGLYVTAYLALSRLELGWTFYTPYSTRGPASTSAVRRFLPGTPLWFFQPAAGIESQLRGNAIELRHD